MRGMLEQIIFSQPLTEKWWLLLLLALFWLGGMYLEIKRMNPQRRLARVLIFSLACLALLLLILKPAYRQAEKTPIAVLLTPDYQEENLDSLSQRKDSLRIFYLEEDRESLTEQGETIASLTVLPKMAPRLRQLYVLGKGVPAYELPFLDHYDTYFLANQEVKGLSSFVFPENGKVDEPLTLAGTYHPKQKDSLWLYLKNPGGTADSVLCVNQDTIYFSLTDRPKEAGKFLYQFVVKNAKDEILQKEIIPLKIAEKTIFKVLVLNSSPQFETKYLKNWLAESGYPVVIQTQISKNKYKEEFLNQSPTSFALNTSFLQKQDLLICDAAYLGSLDAYALGQIRQAVEEGLGLLIQLGERANSALPLLQSFGFQLLPLARTEATLAGQNFDLSGKIELETAPYRFVKKVGIQGLTQAENGETLAAAQIWGWGQIGVSLLAQTYPMQLQEQTDLYAAYWTRILNVLARASNRAYDWQVASSPILQHAPTIITLNSSQTPSEIKVQAPSGQETNLYSRQSPHLSEHWQVQFWPREIGWHQLYLAEDSTSSWSFYVQAPAAWRELRHNRRLQTNLWWQLGRTKTNPTGENIAYLRLQIIPPWVFYLIFLVAVGLLWIETKI